MTSIEKNPSLLSIVTSAGEFGTVPEGLTITKTVHNDRYGTVKVRAYDTHKAAREKETYLNQLAGAVNYPELLGRHGQYLVFRYLNMRDQDSRSTESGFYFQLGKFLATLYATEIDQTDLSSLDDEFAGWLDRFLAMMS